jgi:Bromodomain
MDAVRPKRSNEEAAPASRRQELENELAALRDQETVLARTIELVKAEKAGSKGQKSKQSQSTAAGLRPTADAKDYEIKQRAVRDDQTRRNKQLWSEIRKLVRSLLSKQGYKASFGQPVRSLSWGQIPQNWALYCSKVSEPMDLGTVLSNVGTDEGKRRYTSVEEAKRDLQRISDNARKANIHPDIVRLAGDLEQAWHTEWAKHGIDQSVAADKVKQEIEAQVRPM